MGPKQIWCKFRLQKIMSFTSDGHATRATVGFDHEWKVRSGRISVLLALRVDVPVHCLFTHVCKMLVTPRLFREKITAILPAIPNHASTPHHSLHNLRNCIFRAQCRS